MLQAPLGHISSAPEVDCLTFDRQTRPAGEKSFHLSTSTAFLLPQVSAAPLFAVQTRAAGVKSISCRLSLFFPDAANLMADGILRIFCMSWTLLRLIALLFAVCARASGMESISLAHVNSASSAASLQASGTCQALQLAHVTGTSAPECFVSCCANRGPVVWKAFRFPASTVVPCLLESGIY